MKNRGYRWKLVGFCPECQQSYTLEENKEVRDLVYSKDYYEKMLKDDRPVAMCHECGAYYEDFVLKAVFIY